MTTLIPAPRGLPLIGNALDVDPKDGLRSMIHLAKIHGEIFNLRMPSEDILVVSTHELYNEVCDEKRFQKAVSAGQKEMRHAVKDGLFTAFSGEHAWEVAHRILVPAFGPLAVKDMFSEILEIASQLALKWARYGPEHAVGVTGDFTRLTLDSIALCAMNTRFNSFYTEEQHPFVTAMTSSLLEAGARATRPALVNAMYRGAANKFAADNEYMRKVALDIVAENRKTPTGKKDLVSAMLHGKDPKTGEQMTDDSIAVNMITFLIAGHETTSGFLSFIFFRLMDNPTVMKKAQEEVDNVCGKDPIEYEHTKKLPYLTAIMRETIRLTPSATQLTVQPIPTTSNEPTTIGGGKYLVKPDQIIRCVMPLVMTDPAVWGDDAEEFKPERMLDENFDKLPPNAWKPFGNGKRACIGRGFAWLESTLVLALLLQNFNFRFDDPGYKLHIKQTLTIKPKDLFMHATLRDGLDAFGLEKRITGGKSISKHDMNDTPQIPDKLQGKLKPMAIYYGGESGTCQNLANSAANSAAAHGFKAIVQTLDEATDKLPRDQPILIITSSYEGEPPENARRFFEWLNNIQGSAFEGLQFSVFGCGNSDWRNTFQKIPRVTDELLDKKGASRLCERGLCDVGKSDPFGEYEKWEDEIFWPAVSQKFGTHDEKHDSGARLEVEVSTTKRSQHLRQDVKEAVVISNTVLTSGGDVTTQTIHLRLPTDYEYRSGDYLAILPMNPAKTALRVIRRFGIPWDANITVRSGSSVLPLNTPLSIYDTLAAYVELSQPATKRNLNVILNVIPDEAIRAEVQTLADPETFAREITAKRVSVLDLLERYPTAALPFGDYLAMLPQLRLRLYSISSSPLADPGTCTLTSSVLAASPFSGGPSPYLGAASTYLSNLAAGDHVHVGVRPSHPSFHLPADPASTPLILIAAGSGIAPFRGFVQERAAQLAGGRPVAPAMLFYGCRSPATDALYTDELARWEEQGAVDVRHAFSREPTKSVDARYVQDRLWSDREEVRALFAKGAKVFVCGSGRMGEGVKAMVMKIKAEGSKNQTTDEELEKWYADLRNERFMTDLFD